MSFFLRQAYDARRWGLVAGSMSSDGTENGGGAPFEEDAPGAADSDTDKLFLDIDGFEGPIDILLALARDQKVDLTKISILQLADQYLSFVAKARALRLELAADYLVMAAWLAYLKSRLLLPGSGDGEEEVTAAELAARLAFQLQRLEAMRNAGRNLLERPQLGRDFFARGNPEPIETLRRPVFEATLHDLLVAYGSFRSRDVINALRIDPSDLYSTERALGRLKRMIGETPDWATLASFLPEGLHNRLIRRSALASTFSAALELAKAGELVLRQSGPLSPLYVRRNLPDGAGEGSLP
jgi:segregation and condensation protein A